MPPKKDKTATTAAAAKEKGQPAAGTSGAAAAPKKGRPAGSKASAGKENTSNAAQNSSSAGSSSSGKVTEESIKMILEYLQARNRPYNVNDIFNNLHGSVGKSAVPKCLDVLVERGQVTAKQFNKQVVYVINQDNFDLPSQEELDRMDLEIASMKEQLQTAKAEVKAKQATLSSLSAQLTLEQARARISKLQSDSAGMTAKIASILEGKVRVDPEEKAQVDKDYAVVSKELKKRKKMCMDILSTLTEASGQKVADMMEEMGIEMIPE